MAHQVGTVPPQPIEHCDDVGHRLGDRELALLSRRCHTALLVGSDPVAASKFGQRVVEVVEVQTRTAVKRQHPRTGARNPPRQLAGPCRPRKGRSSHVRRVGLLKKHVLLIGPTRDP